MTSQLYTRIQHFELPGQRFISLDLTRSDFRSNPSLCYYVKHWYIDVDELIDFLLSSLTQQITLITSDYTAQIACNVLRPLFPQIVRLIIVGKRPLQTDNAEHFSHTQSLVDHLSFSIRNRRRLYITFDSWPVERSSHDLVKHTAKHLWYNYFYLVLSRLKNTHVAREEMLASIKAFHSKQTETVQRACVEFQQTYHSDDIIKWYTRESFFYLLLNRTLRSADINHIFAMRYVVTDLETYLQRNRYSSHSRMTVYRGQQMGLEEVMEIEANQGGLIGLTAFWSTTRSEQNAFGFTEIWPRHRVDPVERVMFIIDVPTGVQGVYADLVQYSTIRSELEVLFSYRSIFRVERVKRSGNDNLWFIDVTLIDESDEQYMAIMHPWYSSTTDIIGQRSFFTPISNTSNVNFFRDLTSDNGSFLAFQLLMDMMLRLDQNEYAREELLLACRESYADDPIELEKIDTFARSYHPQDAIKWYTTDCFLYRLINRSLVTESTDLIFRLRYFIHDLHNQLAELQTEYLRRLSSRKGMLQLYRGLRMREHELHDLQRHEGKLVSTNTFLSTTTDYGAALCFAADGMVEEGYVSVVYQIHVDTEMKPSIPFAETDYRSIFKDEDEVLFSMAAVFCVGPTEQLKDRLWTTELTLTSTEDEQWNVLTSHLHSR